MPVSISDYIGIHRNNLRDIGCFDTILDIDSRFFINFMRLRDTETPEFLDAYEKILNLFRNICILLTASQSLGDRFWREAFQSLNMSELEELCLGYSLNSTSGSGSGAALKTKILQAGKEIITAGIRDPEIFELVGLLEEGIGPDRISDMIGRTISDNLRAYSVRVIESLPLSTAFRNQSTFINGLLLNPFNNKVLYMVPLELLHELPIAKEWEDIDKVCALNAQLRQEINAQIGNTWHKQTILSKKYIVKRILLERPDIFSQLIQSYRNSHLDEYNFEIDPLGEALCHSLSAELTTKFPIRLQNDELHTTAGFVSVVRAICNQFKRLLENNGLHEILYYNGKPRRERIAQKTFFAVADSYCRANNLDISPEVNSGRGSVDFKISRGYEIRIIVEVKLTTNHRLVHGFTRQLREYQQSENMAQAFYLVIDNGGPATRMENLIRTRDNEIRENAKVPELLIANALPRASASRA